MAQPDSPEKLLKPDAHYVALGLPFRQCFQCRYYVGDRDDFTETGKCETVQGEVDPEAGCGVFQPRHTPTEILKEGIGK